MAALLPILIQLAPILINLIAKNQGPIQDFLGNLTGGQANPISGIAGLLGGGSSGSSNPEIVRALNRVAAALEALAAPIVPPHPTA